MARPRFEKLPPEKRERLLEVAARAFAAHGYEGASMNQILEEASISKGAAYYYFDDKADLFATVVQHYSRDLMGEMPMRLETLDAESFWPTLAALYLEQFVASYEKPWIFGVVKAASRLPPELLQQSGLADCLGEVMGWISTLLQQGQTAGVVRTDLPDDLLFALFAALDDASDRWLLAHWNELELDEIKGIAARVFETMRRLLAPPEVTHD